MDVYLESFDGASPEHREGANNLKVGDKLRLQGAPANEEQQEGADATPEGLLLVVTAEGGPVGYVKQSFLQGKTFMTLCATVRSIKRDKETSEVLQVNCYNRYTTTLFKGAAVHSDERLCRNCSY